MVQPPAGLDPDDPLVRRAVLGFEVEQFWDSPVGVYLRDRVSQRLDVLMISLKTMDPTKALEITRVQAEILHWEGFAAWIGEAIRTYHEAAAQLEADQDNG